MGSEASPLWDASYVQDRGFFGVQWSNRVSGSNSDKWDGRVNWLDCNRLCYVMRSSGSFKDSFAELWDVLGSITQWPFAVKMFWKVCNSLCC